MCCVLGRLQGKWSGRLIMREWGDHAASWDTIWLSSSVRSQGKMYRCIDIRRRRVALLCGPHGRAYEDGAWRWVPSATFRGQMASAVSARNGFASETSEDCAEFPSWTWAAKGCRKQFWTAKKGVGAPLLDKTQQARIDDATGALHVRGYVHEYGLVEYEYQHDEIWRMLSGRLVRTNATRNGLHPKCVLRSSVREIGLADFGDEPLDEAHVLFLNEMDLWTASVYGGPFSS